MAKFFVANHKMDYPGTNHLTANQVILFQGTNQMTTNHVTHCHGTSHMIESLVIPLQGTNQVITDQKNQCQGVIQSAPWIPSCQLWNLQMHQTRIKILKNLFCIITI